MAPERIQLQTSTLLRIEVTGAVRASDGFAAETSTLPRSLTSLRLFFNPYSNPRFGRLRRICKYLAVPCSLVSCCKYLLLPLCHDRGREFESRRPRHSS
jgi:hypothetical protein